MEIKLLISVSSCRDWKPQFGASMCGLTQNLFTNGLGGRLKTVELGTKFQASCLSEAREQSLLYAEKEGFTHWLSLDDDMAFPGDLVEQLIKHNLPVITANYRRKQERVLGVCLTTDGAFLNSTGKTGLEEVGWMGGGCLLVELDKIKEVVPPRFSVLWVKEKQSYMDQDNYFALRLRENGIKIYCDHDVSNQIQHIGDVAYQFPKGDKCQQTQQT